MGISHKVLAKHYHKLSYKEKFNNDDGNRQRLTSQNVK